jgi:hypothetical protein
MEFQEIVHTFLTRRTANRLKSANVASGLNTWRSLKGKVWRFVIRNYSLPHTYLGNTLFLFHNNLKAKPKAFHYTPRKHFGKRRYNTYSFSTSAIDGGERSAWRPDRDLVPGKGPPLPTVQEAGWAPEPVWTQRLEEKSSVSAGDRTSIARSSSP